MTFLFKLLVGDRSPTFRQCVWDLPKEVDGQWVPGEWTTPVQPGLGVSGYHLTDDPVRWWSVVHQDTDQQIYIAETRGKVDGCAGIGPFDVAVESARLLRPLTDEELADLNVIRSDNRGKKDPLNLAVVTGGELFCGDVGTLHAFNRGGVNLSGHISGCVNLYQHSRATIRGSGFVHAMGDSTVSVFGAVKVQAVHGSNIHARDKCTVECHNEAKVTLYGDTQAKAYGGRILAGENSSVLVMEEGVSVHAMGNAVVTFPAEMGKKLCLTREGQAVLRPVGSPLITTGTGLNGREYLGDWEWKKP